jgi:hypothetical protein
VIAAGQWRGAADHERQSSDIAGERHWIRASGRFHAGNDGELFHDRIVRTDLLVHLWIARSRQAELQSHQSHWIESGIGRAKIKEALDQETCACQEQKRERDLGDDEEGAEPVCMQSAGGAFRALLEGFIYVRFRDLKRGNESEHEGAADGENESKGADGEVHFHLRDVGQALGAGRGKKIDAPHRQEQTGDAAQQREQEAFAKQLPNNPAPAGPQCGADRNLPAA